MSRLNRYIARQFLTNVFVLFVILFCFIITIDVALNIDRFLRIAVEMNESGGAEDTFFRRIVTTTVLVLDLWWPRLVQLFNFMLGLVMTAAMGFTFAQLVRHRELVAALASGLSLWRIATPVLVVALGLTAVQVFNHEVVLPRIAPLLTRDHGDAGKRDLGSQSVPLTRDGQGRLIYATSFDADAGTLEGLHVWMRDDSGLARTVARADHAHWRDGAWVLRDGVLETRGSSDRRVTPLSRVETNLDPTALRMQRYAGYRHNLSFLQVSSMLDRADQLDSKMRDQLERTRFGRFSVMLTNLLTLLIVLPFFLTREPRNMVVQSLKASPLALVALVGGVLGSSAAIPGVPAAVGVFVPVLCLAPVAVAMAGTIRS